MKVNTIGSKYIFYRNTQSKNLAEGLFSLLIVPAQ